MVEDTQLKEVRTGEAYENFVKTLVERLGVVHWIDTRHCILYLTQNWGQGSMHCIAIYTPDQDTRLTGLGFVGFETYEGQAWFANVIPYCFTADRGSTEFFTNPPDKRGFTRLKNSDRLANVANSPFSSTLVIKVIDPKYQPRDVRPFRYGTFLLQTAAQIAMTVGAKTLEVLGNDITRSPRRKSFYDHALGERINGIWILGPRIKTSEVRLVAELWQANLQMPDQD
ncbi:MAG: hypothetical protein ABIE03_06405 [Patescibacteria group bacterium]|nr:hypothetical protein [Patescibacteria group bacterium]